jgi:outer membrane receptor protein involved in Fe transport
VLGASYDYATVHFESDTELAQLLTDRGTQGSGIFVKDSKVRLNTATESYSIFFSNHFSITDELTLMLSGRYNHTRLSMENRFIDDEDKLSGIHSFDRFNPAVGLTYQVAEPITFYGSYSESSRVPTPMELSCADENDPCKLPNAFIADPPLAQVVAKTWEVGMRGDLTELITQGQSTWHLGFFHTTNHNDIIFNQGGASISTGFFSNIGKTRRYGIEAGINVDYPAVFSAIDDWHFSSNYTYLNAQFLDSFVIQNPLDNEQASTVMRGNRIPGLPEHIFKASLGVDLWQRSSIILDTLYSGDQFFRGDEANQTSHLGGYWLFNLRTEVKLTDQVTLFARIDNLFDRQYKSLGVYGDATEVLGEKFDQGQFISPGAPRAGWIGIRLTL